VHDAARDRVLRARVQRRHAGSSPRARRPWRSRRSRSSRKWCSAA
jgi:hypothetical protein